MIVKAMRISAIRPPMCVDVEPSLASDFTREEAFSIFAVQRGPQEMGTIPYRPG